MLVGKYQNSLDAKFRMIIPAKFRDDLGYKCVISKAIDNCLDIYPVTEWESFVDRLSQLPSSDAAVRAFTRHFFAGAVECEIDKQGRVTVPQELREYAGIKKEMISIGANKKIELWAKEQIESGAEPIEMDPKELAANMEKYGF